MVLKIVDCRTIDGRGRDSGACRKWRALTILALCWLMGTSTAIYDESGRHVVCGTHAMSFIGQ